jgi:hypothetical protein
LILQQLAGFVGRWDERRRGDRNRLCGRGALARQVTLRRRTLFDWKQRFSSFAVEHEHEAVLGRLRDCIDALAVAFQRDEHGWRRKVEEVVEEEELEEGEEAELEEGAEGETAAEEMPSEETKEKED